MRLRLRIMLQCFSALILRILSFASILSNSCIYCLWELVVFQDTWLHPSANSNFSFWSSIVGASSMQSLFLIGTVFSIRGSGVSWNIDCYFSDSEITFLYLCENIRLLGGKFLLIWFASKLLSGLLESTISLEANTLAECRELV